MTAPFEITGRRIGPGLPVYVVAEMSANHNGDLDRARRIIEAAAAAGADAVKLQTYTAESLTLDMDGDLFRVHGTQWDGQRLYDLYAEAATPWEWHAELRDLAADVGIDLFSAAFDDDAVAFLEGLGFPAHKIASFELVDLPLVRRAAATGKPLILSTGMATLAEVREAVTTAREAGATQIALLKCTSSYPAPPSDMNLRGILLLQEEFDLPVGLSDHSLDPTVAAVAVALGACIVEKHFTLSRESGGPDSAFSLEPGEFGTLVKSIRLAEQALGEATFGPSNHERESLAFRRSLFAVADIEPGELLTPANVRSIRPAGGLAPKHLDAVLGRPAARRIARGTPLSWEDVAS